MILIHFGAGGAGGTEVYLIWRNYRKTTAFYEKYKTTKRYCSTVRTTSSLPVRKHHVQEMADVNCSHETGLYLPSSLSYTLNYTLMLTESDPALSSTGQRESESGPGGGTPP